ncbi:MAG: aminoglycoside phosphotransferase family protein [Propionibacteriales bacterium]|nr:aminoglycoside phosphotransferase family protein [Propionibacteriales bacterium]
MTMNAPGPTLFADAVHAVAAHHGVRDKDVVPAPVQGQVNLTVFLGSELVLRIPRTTGAADKLAKEAQVIALVRDAGVPTPELVRHDSTRRIADVPYMILQRVHGATMAEQDPEPMIHQRTLASLGEILVTLHQIKRKAVGPVSSIPEPFAFSPTELLGELVRAGEIGTAQHDWLLDRFTLLQPEGPPLANPILLHRDVIGSNVMVDRDGVVIALLDWGCAEWGSPARDLVGLPIRSLPDLMSAYRSASGTSSASADREGDHTLERDALWYHLYLSLARLLKRRSTSEDRNWAAPRSATLLDFLAFTSDTGPGPWRSLLHPTALS